MKGPHLLISSEAVIPATTLPEILKLASFLGCILDNPTVLVDMGNEQHIVDVEVFIDSGGADGIVTRALYIVGRQPVSHAH